MRNISRFLIPPLRFVYPITPKESQPNTNPVTQRKFSRNRFTFALTVFCVFFKIQITMDIFLLNLHLSLPVDVLVLRCARGPSRTGLVLCYWSARGDNLVSMARTTFRSHVLALRYIKGHRIVILSDSGEGSAKNKE